MKDSISELQNEINKFAEERDWGQFHSPANLAKSISIEAGELLECFQWNDDNYSIDAVREELADVMNYCLRMASVLNLNVSEIILEKIGKNAVKYPVDKARGNYVKYTEFIVDNE